MVKSLSIDLRERVVAAVDEGVSCHEAARRFGVSASSAIRWVSAWRSTGSIAPKPMGGDRRSHYLEQYAELILGAVEEQVDITIVELQSLLKKHDVVASYGAVWNLLDRHDLTFKKRPPTLPNRTARTSQKPV